MMLQLTKRELEILDILDNTKDEKLIAKLTDELKKIDEEKTKNVKDFFAH